MDYIIKVKMEDIVFTMFGIICSKCNSVLDVISSEDEFLYIDKVCECGSIGFYTYKIKIKLVTERPYGKEPFYKIDEHEFFI